MHCAELSDRDFRRFSALVYGKCGIELHAGKKALVRARLSKRLRERGFESFRAYYQFVTKDDSGDELVRMLDAISTNLTSFFREERHFDFLKKTVFPSWMAGNGRYQRIRVWSAGCSSGEEPYSLAICMKEYFGDFLPNDTKILATDISTQVLARARSGIYAGERLDKIPAAMLRKYFQKGYGNQEGNFRVKQPVRDMISFQRLNLMEPFCFQDPFAFIFCRNVMIYFNKQTQEELVNKFYDCLADGGYLIIGHSESLTGIANGFRYVQPTIYQKEGKRGTHGIRS
ncbi:MAG: protein-glutamate O-methyltransferase CheR [Deltaproteobacteria bacterium]|nr:protein-glutamate O-methyltransferase CheR [Deltaproteobacteria bacterium]